MTKNSDKTKHQALESKVVPVRVIVDLGDGFERIYANHANVRISPVDTTIEFLDVGEYEEPRVEGGKTSTEITVKPKVRVVLPPSVFANLAAIMSRLVEEHFVKVSDIDAD